MTADSLLVWMSARGAGSWQQFRAAVEELHLGDESGATPADIEDAGAYGLPLYQLLRLNLQRLGHAEFFGGAGGPEWRVVPPTLAIAGDCDDGLGVVIGARSPMLLRRLTAACGDVSLQSSSVESYPIQLRIRSSGATLRAVAERAGLIAQENAPLLILLSLPRIDDLSTYRPTLLPFGTAWTVERFSASTFGWKPAMRTDTERTGLFRFSFRYERRVFYCARGRTTELGAQTGKYLVLHRRRRKVFDYDRGARTVSVRPSCRPPFLIERALILCSGLPPTFADRRLVYAEVPEEIGALAAQLLRQDF
jgi:hypothetical protein